MSALTVMDNQNAKKILIILLVRWFFKSHCLSGTHNWVLRQKGKGSNRSGLRHSKRFVRQRFYWAFWTILLMTSWRVAPQSCKLGQPGLLLPFTWWLLWIACQLLAAVLTFCAACSKSKNASKKNFILKKPSKKVIDKYFKKAIKKTTKNI